MNNDKTLQPLAGMTLEDMQDAVASLGMPRFVAKQLAQWIYQKRVKERVYVLPCHREDPLQKRPFRHHVRAGAREARLRARS